MTSNYYLISKLSNIPFNEYKGKSIRLSKNKAYFVDEVMVGVNGEDSNIRKITTFKDSKGKIVERCFEYSDKPVKNRVYNRIRKLINNNAVVDSKEIKEYEIPKGLLKKFLKKSTTNKNSLWQPLKFETHHIYFDKDNGLVHSLTRADNFNKNNSRHTIVEFPHRKSGESVKTDKKLLSFEVDKNGEIIPNSETVQNVKVPKKDSFLGIRVLSAKDCFKTIVNRFIKEHGNGLERAGVKVNFYKPGAEYRDMECAHFTPVTGAVEFSRYSSHINSKPFIVMAAGHETEHAWQYFLHARNGGAKYNWEKKVARQFGDLGNNPKLQKEAESYFDAIEDYVSLRENKKAYHDNYIEVLARKVGDSAKQRYIDEGKELYCQFPYIPQDLF